MQRVPIGQPQPQQMRFAPPQSSASTQRRGPGGQFAPAIDHSAQQQQQQQQQNGQMMAHQQAYMQAQAGRALAPSSTAMAVVGQQPGGGGAQGGPGQRKRKRFADKVILPEIRAVVPEANAYMDLLTFEQKLDAMLARKKLEIQETLKRPLKVKKRLRIYVSHSFIPGREPEREGDEGSVPQWELRVEGRLFEEPAAQAAAAQAAAAAAPGWLRNQQSAKRKFSSFFKSLVIELDKDIYGPDNHLVEWNRTPDTKETDGFQVKRPGDRDVKCTILLLLDYQPMKFKLHPKLAKLLGIALETRPKIIEALWQYLKTHRLQDATDRDVINCDAYLEQVFGVKKMRFMEIPQRVQSLLQHPDPLVLNHLIRSYDGQDKNTACYDIEVEVDDAVKHQMGAFLQNHTSMPDIAALDQKIYDIVEQVNELKVRRDFYANFADHPREFVEQWLVSQSRDLKNMTEQSQDFELERHADHYFQPHTQEGVHRYVYGRIIQKRLELEATLGVKYN